MRPRLLAALLVLALAIVVVSAFWPSDPLPVSEPVAARPPVVHVEDAGLVALDGIPPLPTLIEVVEPSPPDAGEKYEVTIEVFDEKGHAAGQSIHLQNPPCPTDGGLGMGVTLNAQTNVMGLARIALTEGAWEIENFHSSPMRIDVEPTQTHFVIHKSEPMVGTIEGFVVDDQSLPIADAVVGIPGSPGSDAWAMRNVDRSPHAPPVGDLATLTDALGHFVLRTYEPSLVLKASKDLRVSNPVVAASGSKAVQLRIFTPAWARFSIPCVRGFIQYDYQGENIEVATDGRSETMVAAGTRIFKMRCMRRGMLFSAATETTLAPSAREPVSFSPTRLDGLQVKVVDARGPTIPGATVVARDPRELQVALRVDGGFVAKPQALGITDKVGLTYLLPTELTAYDPVFRIDVVGPWRTQREVLARLGDQPVEVVAVPR